MRIAQVAPLAEPVPPKLYGGTERVVSWLTDELVDQGHDVTLFASGDSNTKANLVSCAPRALRLAGIRDHTASLLVMLSDLRQRADEFDMIHFHVDQLQFPLFADIRHKCVTTLHGRLDMPDFHPIYRAFPRMPLVSISDSQRLPMPPGLNWIATVHHGMPAEKLRFNSQGGDYLVFLGRISPEKGPDRAIEVAKRTGIPLKIAAKVDAVDREYFDHAIRPIIDDPLVEFLGEVNDSEKEELLGNARALLFPIDWPEPFGLVMIEAMATGTPVVAFRCGSVPEVIDHGLSGLIVDSIDEMAEAVGRIGDLSRRTVRQLFETRFSASAMARSYVEAYEKTLASGAAVIRSRPKSERSLAVMESGRNAPAAEAGTAA